MLGGPLWKYRGYGRSDNFENTTVWVQILVNEMGCVVANLRESDEVVMAAPARFQRETGLAEKQATIL